MTEEKIEKPADEGASQNYNLTVRGIDKRTMATAQNAFKAIQDALGPTEEIRKRMKLLSNTLSENSAMSRAVKQIEAHQKTLDAIKPLHEKILDPILDHPDLYKVNSARQLHDITTQLKTIENPIHETNKRLANIENRFSEMYEIATEAAQIANGLNAAAAEFLVKFEQAALSNEKSARKAILIGAVAIMIAVLMPVFQIAYNELWVGPKEAAEAQAIISDLKSEIAGLQQQQNQNLQDLAEALPKPDNSTLDVLRDIKGILSNQSAQENVVPNIGME